MACRAVVQRLDVRRRDVVIAALVAVIAVVGTIHIEPEAGRRAADAGAFSCAIVGAVTLVFWRRFAVAVALVAGAAVTIYLLRHYPGGPALLAGPVSLFYLGYRERRRVLALAVTAIVAKLMLVASWIGEAEITGRGVVAIGWPFAAALAGMLAATRGERLLAERERQATRQRQAIADERLRIARDLHDSVAHALATINVQSGVAAHLLEHQAVRQTSADRDAHRTTERDRVETAREALETIRSASSEVLDELSEILNTLRDNGGDAPLAPLAGLDRFDDLVERARADGLRVDHTVTGDATTVIPSVSAAAYRVVQEALSNTRRHAGSNASASVSVLISSPGDVSVEVIDDGGAAGGAASNGADDAPTDASSGLGLVGMRERVESTGGVLSTGHRRGNGYRVAAEWRGARHRRAADDDGDDDCRRIKLRLERRQ